MKFQIKVTLSQYDIHTIILGDPSGEYHADIKEVIKFAFDNNQLFIENKDGTTQKADNNPIE